MTRSHRPRLRELRDIYLLLGECRELGRDLRAWQAHLVSGLHRILHARLGCSVLASFEGFDGISFQNACFVGLEEGRESALFHQYHRSGDMQKDPMAIAHKQIPGPVVSRRRVELVPDFAWRRSATFQWYLRPLHLQDVLMGRLATGDGLGLHLGFVRDERDPLFDIRHRRILQLLSLALRPLLGACLSLTESRDPLPPRLRDVLHLLMEGRSEKEVAHQLGISTHTAHFHINRLHHIFNVNSRGELLARAFTHHSLRDSPSTLQGLPAAP